MNVLFSKISSVVLAAALTPLSFGLLTDAARAQDLAPSSAASCRVQNAPATTVYGVPADQPSLATEFHLTGVTAVQVDIDDTGAVLNTAVAKSSGFPMLDRAAVAAAQASAFRPEIKDCAPVAGSYLFMVDFSQ